MNTANPELRRNLWLEFSIHRVIAAPVVIGLIALLFLSAESKEVMNNIAMLNSRCSERSSVSTRACTVTSSAVVGSSAIRSVGLLISAIAIITR